MGAVVRGPQARLVRDRDGGDRDEEGEEGTNKLRGEKDSLEEEGKS